MLLKTSSFSSTARVMPVSYPNCPVHLFTQEKYKHISSLYHFTAVFLIHDRFVGGSITNLRTGHHTMLVIEVSPWSLTVLGECRTLWFKHKQAMHYSIDWYVAKSFTPLEQVQNNEKQVLTTVLRNSKQAFFNRNVNTTIKSSFGKQWSTKD